MAKQAKAKTLPVTLERIADHAQLELRDDGVGFDPKHVRLGAHGLTGRQLRTQ